MGEFGMRWRISTGSLPRSRSVSRHGHRTAARETNTQGTVIDNGLALPWFT